MTKTNNNISVSFEFFPPKTEKSEAIFWNTIEKLELFNPSFISLTYGAGGSNQNNSKRIIKTLCKKNLNVAAHLTCVGASRDQSNKIALDFINMGVNHIVALRGDVPEGQGNYIPHNEGYRNATDLVKGLRQISTKPIDISVAAYPEVHPDSESEEKDLENLKRKIDAGADRAITQFFFENDVFLRFRDKAVSAGISVPIIPGIMPVTNFNKIKNMANKVSALIPDWLDNKFEGVENDLEACQSIAMDFNGNQILELKREGVKNFHFYTMNKNELISELCNLIGIRQTMSQYL